MPQITVWMLRVALLYLGTGFTFGALMLFNKGVPVTPGLWRLLPLHIEAVLLGWTIQLAVGMAYWILPRFEGGDRGPTGWMWAGFFVLNGGLLLVMVGVWWVLPMLILIGRVAELTAVIVFAFQLVPRIKPPGA